MSSVIFDFITALCFFTIAVMVALFIVRTKLVYRLRENYPQLHACVGRPIEISRSIGFLWRLERHKVQLSKKDLNLLRLNLLLVYTSMVTITLFMILVFIWFPYTMGSER